MSTISVEKVPLKKFFSDDFFFSIPEYQRPYSWKKEHCEQLFDDIKSVSSEENEYFLGTIILQEMNNVGTGKSYDVIDGQQRLTTLQLLLACLRDGVEDGQYKKETQKKIYEEYNPVDGIPEKVRLDVREEQFFKEYIQIDNGTNKIDGFVFNNDAQENLYNAIQTFKEKIRILTQEQIQKIIQTISQRCVVIYASTSNFEDSYRLFTIVNDRGLQLRRIDILKANNLAPQIITNAEERKAYALKWERMEEELGVDEFESLISFIRTIEVKERAKEDILKEYEKLILGKKVNKGTEFINYVKDYKDIYQQLILDKDVFDCEDDKSTAISYKNLLHIMIDYLPSNEWIPPLLYYYKRFRNIGLLDYLQLLEKKFVADWILGLTPTSRRVNMITILKLIEDSNHSTEVLQNEVFQYDLQEFQGKLNKDIYGKNYATYLLLKLEYLESEKNVEKRYGTVSVEHVLPQNPNSTSEWVKIFNADDRKKWTNKLANLVLLSKRKNSTASNCDFSEKKVKYFRDRITDLARSNKILAFIEWTPELLESRQSEINALLSS